MMLSIVVVVLVLAGCFWLLRDYSVNLKSYNDRQLYARYSRWRAHACEFPLADTRGQKVWDEVRRMEAELKGRGYDMEKLEREDLDAKLKGRALDFSQCRAADQS